MAFKKLKQVVAHMNRAGKGLRSLGGFITQVQAGFMWFTLYIATNDATVIHGVGDDHLSFTGAGGIQAAPATLPECIATATALKASLISHAAEVASHTTFGAHKIADTALAATLAAIPAATDQGTVDTLANGIQTFINAHLTSAGVHFHNDATSANATTAASNLATCSALLTALVTYVHAHYDRAIAGAFTVDTAGDEGGAA